MKKLLRAYFHQKIFQKKVGRKLIRSGSGSGTGSGRFRKSDPVKNRPDPQHCIQGINKYTNLTLCVLRLRLLITYFTDTTDN
jgi:hypothetical protein